MGGLLVRNVDYPERFIRIVVGLILGNLGFANPGFPWLEGMAAVQTSLVVISLYLLISGLVGVCPLRSLRRRRAER